jgi:hypothetical protein
VAKSFPHFASHRRETSLAQPCREWRLPRRTFISGLCGFLGWTMLGGCTTPLAFRSQSPELEEEAEIEADTKLVGNYAIPFGMVIQKVEGLALVTGLPGTGGDCPPGSARNAMMRELQARNVPKPQEVLNNPSTALVLVRGFVRPGAQKGDRFDLEVRLPSSSECTSLRGGWMMETRLTESAYIDGQMYEGHLIGLGKGPIMTDPNASSSDDPSALGRGRVLGAGTLLKPRPIGLAIKPDKQDVRISAALGAAINRRFHTFHEGRKEPVASPKTEEYIELLLHERYKHNVPRYMAVLRSIPLQESTSERIAREALLERQLLDPITAATAAVRLEAIGKEGARVLKKGLESRDPEVKFYAAEALAYLDEGEAAPVLGQLAADEPAFRVFALTALSAMDDYAAYEELRKLLDVASAETRYGAFRSLWAMNPNDPLVRGEMMNDRFSYHVLHTGGPPMIHATRSFRPELVVFGHEQRITTPFTLDAANNKIMVTGDSSGVVSVARFDLNGIDQKRQVENTVDAIVRAMAELEADYPDVVQVLQQAKQQNLLSGRFEVDALPAANRSYENRGNDEEDSTEEETSSSSRNIQVTSATPGLFDDSKTKDKPAKRRESSVLTGNKGGKKEVSRWDAFRDKMTPWKSDE